MWIFWVLIVGIALAQKEYAYGKQVKVWMEYVAQVESMLGRKDPKGLFKCDVKYADEDYEKTFVEEMENKFCVDSGIDVNFKVNFTTSSFYCSISLTPSQKLYFKKAIALQTQIYFLIDNLPASSPLGFIDPDTEIHYIYTEHIFTFQYNSGYIVHASVQPSKPTRLSLLYSLDFYSSSYWIPTTFPSNQRLILISNQLIEESWAFNLVWWTCGIIVIAVCNEIRKVIIKDLDKLNSEDFEWGRLQREYYKSPENIGCFIAAVSIGRHIFGAFVFMLFHKTMMPNYTNYEWPFQNFFLKSLFLSLFAGFFYGALYREYRGKGKIKAFMIYVIVPIALISCVYLTFRYQTLGLVPTIKVLAYLALRFVLPYFLLQGLGFYLGLYYKLSFYLVETQQKCDDLDNFTAKPSELCAFYHVSIEKNHAQSEPTIVSTHKLHEDSENTEFPENLKYAIYMAGGFFCFFSIYPSLFIVLNAYFSDKIFLSYEILCGGCFFGICASSTVGIVSSFVGLKYKDFKWHWGSFTPAACTGICNFIYCWYIFIAKFSNTELWQWVYYFIFNITGSLGLGLACGAIGYQASKIFVSIVAIGKNKDT